MRITKQFLDSINLAIGPSAHLKVIHKTVVDYLGNTYPTTEYRGHLVLFEAAEHNAVILGTGCLLI